jgi:DNA invertase Pin-like site-specific DNA recombinase
VDCLNNIRTLEEDGIRFIAVTQGLDTDQRNPASRFLLHVLGAAAEFERALIRERTRAGQQRYRQDYAAGKVGKTVYSRSGRNMPPHRPKKVFDREEVIELRRRGMSIREIAKKVHLGMGTVARTLRDCDGAQPRFGAAIESVTGGTLDYLSIAMSENPTSRAKMTHEEFRNARFIRHHDINDQDHTA